MTWHPERILIIGKTYPLPSGKQIETVCTGGICSDGTWRRLYPINYRYLQPQQKYRTWDWVQAEVDRYQADPRTCSYAIQEESLTVVGHEDSDTGKWRWIEPLLSESHEALDRRHDADRHGVTMAAIEIRMEALKWERTAPDGTALEKLRQELLFVTRKPLTIPPLQLMLRFRCANSSECPAHTKSILAWDVQQAYLNWTAAYGEDESLRRLKEMAEARLDPVKRRPIALLSTIKDHPDTWSIGGFFYPRREDAQQGSLAWGEIPP